ncbi:MAG: type II toxin-antitoxin system VapC family toxin [Betaproteobacteria bacterium]|nr:MAG: type II toxin-antitoxin system VapC family toxin [Betaproteobacteria bacterium]
MADRALAGSEHSVSDDLVLDVVEGSALTAYDAELVALARALSVPLVTSDKAVFKAFPDLTLTMEAFVAR